MFRRFDKVFAFTFKNQVKSASFRNLTIIVALLCFAVPLAIFSLVALNSEDEKKDIECAKNAGAISVLINRTDEEKNYGQDYTIQSLTELLNL